MSSNLDTNWTDERRGLVKKLWVEGLSAGLIAAQLGNTTRNAVIGIIHRAGLSGRGAPTSFSARVVVAGPPPVFFDPTGRKTIREHAFRPKPKEDAVGRHICKWPIGDPREEGFQFCGAAATGNYCADHHAIAFAAPKPRAPRNGTELARSLRRYL